MTDSTPSSSEVQSSKPEVPDGVKMSFRSLSNEITIYEIKTPGPNPEMKLINHIELVDGLTEQGDEETRMDAALVVETQLMEDEPIEEVVVTTTKTEKFCSLDESPLTMILGDCSGTDVASPLPEVESVETVDIKAVSLSGSNKTLKVQPRRRKRKRIFTPSRLPNTSIYRTRTMVRAATLAAQNQKPSQSTDQVKPTVTPVAPVLLARSPVVPKPKTMKEVLASIPGFGAGRPRKRHNRKLSTAEQLEQTKKDGCIDLETPGSVLTQVNLRAILNKHTFSVLPSLYQFKLLQLLPEVDTVAGSDYGLKLSSSALTNEFFAKSCQEWRERLAAGELTPEHRQKNKLEADRERSKLDPWKVKHFEPIWGDKTSNSSASRKQPPRVPTKATPSSTAAKPSTAPAGHGHCLRRSPARQNRPSPSINSVTETAVPSPFLRSSPTSTKSVVCLKRKYETDALGIETTANMDNYNDASSGEESDVEEQQEIAVSTGVCQGVNEVMTSSNSVKAAQDVILSSSPSPSTKRPGSIEDIDKPPVLVKKIKIIPPMPPSGKQVPFNMEVKVDEIQPATPVLTPSTDPDGDGEVDSELVDEEVMGGCHTSAVDSSCMVPSPEEGDIIIEETSETMDVSEFEILEVVDCTGTSTLGQISSNQISSSVSSKSPVSNIDSNSSLKSPMSIEIHSGVYTEPSSPPSSSFFGSTTSTLLLPRPSVDIESCEQELVSSASRSSDKTLNCSISSSLSSTSDSTSGKPSDDKLSCESEKLHLQLAQNYCQGVITTTSPDITVPNATRVSSPTKVTSVTPPHNSRKPQLTEGSVTKIPSKPLASGLVNSTFSSIKQINKPENLQMSDGSNDSVLPQPLEKPGEPAKSSPTNKLQPPLLRPNFIQEVVKTTASSTTISPPTQIQLTKVSPSDPIRPNNIPSQKSLIRNAVVMQSPNPKTEAPQLSGAKSPRVSCVQIMPASKPVKIASSVGSPVVIHIQSTPSDPIKLSTESTNSESMPSKVQASTSSERKKTSEAIFTKLFPREKSVGAGNCERQLVSSASMSTVDTTTGNNGISKLSPDSGFTAVVSTSKVTDVCSNGKSATVASTSERKASPALVKTEDESGTVHLANVDSTVSSGAQISSATSSEEGFVIVPLNKAESVVAPNDPKLPTSLLLLPKSTHKLDKPNSTAIILSPQKEIAMQIQKSEPKVEINSNAACPKKDAPKKENVIVEAKKEVVIIHAKKERNTNQYPATLQHKSNNLLSQQIMDGPKRVDVSSDKLSALSPAQVAIANATNQLAKNPDVTLKPLIVSTQMPKIPPQLQNVKTLLQIRPVSSHSSTSTVELKKASLIKVDSSISAPTGTTKVVTQQQPNQTIRPQQVFVKMVTIPVSVPTAKSPETGATMAIAQPHQESVKLVKSSETVDKTVGASKTTPLHSQNSPILLKMATSSSSSGLEKASLRAVSATINKAPIPITISSTNVTPNVNVSSSTVASKLIASAGVSVVPLGPSVAPVSLSTSLVSNEKANLTGISVVVSNQSQMSQPNGQQAKIKVSRTSSVPPGSINLERSYQICQAVIQNSPNREQLQNQLVKPPPIQSNKIDPVKILQHQQIQGHQLVSNDPNLIQVQRRSTTPTIIQSPIQTTSMPILSGMQPHQKVIVAHISGPSGSTSGPVTITQHHLHPSQSPHHLGMGNPGTTTVVPLIRPVQPGSPIVVHHGSQRPQLVVSCGTLCSSALTGTTVTNSFVNNRSNMVNLMHMGVGIGSNTRGVGSTTSKHPKIYHESLPRLQAMQMQAATTANNFNSSNNNNVQAQSTAVTGTTATIITPQQLALLIQQQQQQQPQPSSQANTTQAASLQQQQAVQLQRSQPVPISLPLSLPFSTQTISTRPFCHTTQPSRPNSASGVQLSNNSNSSNNTPNPVFISSPGSPQPISVTSSNVTGTSSIKIISGNSFFQPNVRSIPVHIPNQNRQQAVAPNGSASNVNFPIRAQIVTSNGETLTIHRASSIPMSNLNGPIRLRPPYGFNVNMAQVKRTANGNFVITSTGTADNEETGNPLVSTNRSSPISHHLVSCAEQQMISPGQVQNSNPNSSVSSVPVSTTTVSLSRQCIPTSIAYGSQMIRSPLRIVSHSHPQASDVFQAASTYGSTNIAENFNENSSAANNGTSSNGINNSTNQPSSNVHETVNNSVSNLADFITNQLAASNIRSISPLALDNNQRASSVGSETISTTCSPGIYSIQRSGITTQSSQNPEQSFSADNNSLNTSGPSQGEHQSSLMVVSVINNHDNSLRKPTEITQHVDKFPNPMADLINCTNEAMLDLHDAISVNVDSPYSLISEPDPPNIAEIVDVPTTIDNVSTVSSSSSNLGLIQPGNCSNSLSSSVASPVWLNSGSENSSSSPNMIISENPASSPLNNLLPHVSSHILPSPQSTIPAQCSAVNVSVTNTNSKRRLGLDTPVLVSEVDQNTVLVQAPSQQQTQQQQQQHTGSLQRNESPMGMPGHGSGDGVRQQQYIIVQTTGSNGLPTNLAVPASIVLSPQVIMDQTKGPPRASSAPPVQINGNNNTMIISNSNHANRSGNIPISFAGPQNPGGNVSMTMTPIPISVTSGQNAINVQQQHHLNSVGQLGDSSGMKSLQIPLEIQDSNGVRVLYSGQNGQSSIQHVTINQMQQAQQQGHNNHFSLAQNRGSSLQFAHIPQQSLQQQIVAASQNLSVIQNSPTFTMSSQNHSNIVQVQVSQPTQMVHQQTVSQVLNVGSPSHTSTSVVNMTASGINQNSVQSGTGWERGHMVNLNLHGPSSSTVSRIITTTQPGQHPVISIPDTTQNCGRNGDGDNLGGPDYDIFSAIADGVNVKVEGLVNHSLDRNGNGSMNIGVVSSDDGMNMNLSGNNSGVIAATSSSISSRRQNSDFHVEEVGQIILDGTGGNCVCDLRAMIMCRKCGAFCHDDCIGSSELCWMELSLIPAQ
ncbi:unnamed protein product [Allacma fusca]|uniref:DEUBAD domain-containing protein n=1 Tax=Allacma fusca TaxID=39272 RepID=A0A8J2JG46_9HEXA|nr:unnamed protein product [Allacma fusca]